MGELLTCPIDGTPLVMAPDDGVFETACHACRREFRFTRGTLTALQHTKADKEAHHGILLKVHVEDETVEVQDTVFTSRWKDVSKKRAVTVTEQFDRERRPRIVRVESAGAPGFAPHDPGDRALLRTAGVAVRGALLVSFATILAVYFYHWAFLALLPLGALVVAAMAAWRWRRSSTRQAIAPTRLSHLEREQWLLSQLQRYRLQSDDVKLRMTQQARQLAEMEKLARDMAAAKGDYEHRGEVVRRGIDALRHLHDNDQRLQVALAGAMEMVEIEYRASRALDYLPDDAIDRLSTTIAELDAIEAENMMLETQLEANAEVHAIAPA